MKFGAGIHRPQPRSFSPLNPIGKIQSAAFAFFLGLASLWLSSARAADSIASVDLWSLKPLQSGLESDSPVASRSGDGNWLDSYIDHSLAAHQLHRAPVASRRTLARRLYFDLTGLPPSQEEVQAFVQDGHPDAYQRLVQRLLSSPAYGERWARWWLDLARYADSNGQDENKFMANAWRYRDWVVRSFACNQPFDQFVTEQLAGDLLPTNGVPEPEIFDRWIATGFLVLGPKMLAEQDKQKLVMDLVDEQIDVVSRSFLGLTVGCARCHDHKFDPISTRDYYAMAGIFRSTRTMANLDFVSRANERCVSSSEQLAAIQASETALKAKRSRLAAAKTRAQEECLSAGLRDFPQWLRATLSREPQPDGFGTNWTAQLERLLEPDPATNLVSRFLRQAATNHELVELIRNENAPNHTPFHLVKGRVEGGFLATGTNYLEIPHSDDLEPQQLSVEAWVWADNIPTTGDTRRWLVGKNANEWDEGHYALLLDKDRPGVYLNIGGGRDHVISLFSEHHHFALGEWHHLAFTYDGALLRLFVDGDAAAELSVGRPRHLGNGPLALGRRPDGYIYFQGRLDEVCVYNRALGTAELHRHAQQPEDEAVEGAITQWNFNQLSDEQRISMGVAETYQALFGPMGTFRVGPDSQELFSNRAKSEIAGIEREIQQINADAPPPVQMALAVADDKVVDLPVHIRGSHLNLAKESVPRGFIKCLSTTNDSAMPPHQSGRLELAHWLTHSANHLTARVFVNRVWQAHFGEGLVRTSDNFGVRGEHPSHPELLDALALEFIRSGWNVKHLQELIVTSATYRQQSGESPSQDPDNRFLSCFPRQRLEGEMVRDALLAVSSRLSHETGGSLVNWKNDDYAPSDPVSADSLRRSLYLPVVRDRGYDVFGIFDVANSSVCTAKRTPTVVSHQALFFLNGPLVKSSATAMATDLLATPFPDDLARIVAAYQRVLSRSPSANELQRVHTFLDKAKSLIPTQPETGAWSALCQTLLCSNEFLYLD